MGPKRMGLRAGPVSKISLFSNMWRTAQKSALFYIHVLLVLHNGWNGEF